MPIPPRILDNLERQRRNNDASLDIDIVNTKGGFQEALLCANCGTQMGLWTDQHTGQPQGYMCPSCQATFDPDKQGKAQHARTIRRMTTTDGGVDSQTVDMRRSIESFSQTGIKLHDNLYQPRADKSNSSATKSLSKLDYAGQKRKPDSDEQLLKKQGFTILDSQERLPE